MCMLDHVRLCANRIGRVDPLAANIWVAREAKWDAATRMNLLRLYVQGSHTRPDPAASIHVHVFSRGGDGI